MANSWKFMLKKNQLTCFLFDMNFHEYSMNFHKLLYKPFLFFYLIFILILDFRQYAKTMIFSRLRREGLARRPKGKSNYLLGVAYGEKSIKSFQIKQIM